MDYDNNEDVNFQCGKCSNIWNSIGEISDHMNNHHNEDNIEEKDADAGKEIAASVNEEVSKQNKYLQEKNDLLKRKNISLEKETRYTNLALKQSELEKNQLKKQVNDVHESLAEVVKQNTVLNEENKITERADQRK